MCIEVERHKHYMRALPRAQALSLRPDRSCATDGLDTLSGADYPAKQLHNRYPELASLFNGVSGWPTVILGADTAVAPFNYIFKRAMWPYDPVLAGQGACFMSHPTMDCL